MSPMNSNELITAPILELLKKIAIPASVGFFFNTMYNVVDTFYAGLISTEAIAALSLSFPIFFLVIAFGSGLGSGATALISNSLGEGDTQSASRYAVQSISYSFIVAVILSLVGVAAAPFLFGILGAFGEYLVLAMEYIRIIFYGSFLFVLVFTLNAILNSVGLTKPFRNVLVVGFFANLILNPWFVFGGFGVPELGIAGIALATILIQVFSVWYLITQVLKTGLIAKDFYRDLFPRQKQYKELTVQGLPASLAMVLVGVGIFIITFFISTFGQDAVAAYGIATRIEQIFLVPLIGINIATLTLVGQNKGAKKHDRILETLRVGRKYGLWVMTFGATIVFTLTRPLVRIFTQDSNVIEIAIPYLRIAAFMFWAYMLLFLIDAAMRGLKRPMFSLWLNLGRQIIAPVLVFGILIYVYDIGLLGIWWGLFIIVWLSALISLFYIESVLKKLSI